MTSGTWPASELSSGSTRNPDSDYFRTIVPAHFAGHGAASVVGRR